MVTYRYKRNIFVLDQVPATKAMAVTIPGAFLSGSLDSNVLYAGTLGPVPVPYSPSYVNAFPPLPQEMFYAIRKIIVDAPTLELPGTYQGVDVIHLDVWNVVTRRAVRHLRIPAQLRSLSFFTDHPFPDMVRVSVEEGNSYFSVFEDRLLCSADKKTVFLDCNPKASYSIGVDPHTEFIGPYAFKDTNARGMKLPCGHRILVGMGAFSRAAFLLDGESRWELFMNDPQMRELAHYRGGLKKLSFTYAKRYLEKGDFERFRAVLKLGFLKGSELEKLLDLVNEGGNHLFIAPILEASKRKRKKKETFDL